MASRAFLCLALAGVASAQWPVSPAEISPQSPVPDADLLPLELFNRWRYRLIDHRGGTTREVTFRIASTLEHRFRDSHSWLVERTAGEEDLGPVLHWAVQKDGIWAIRYTGLGGYRVDRARLLALPLGLEAHWQWEGVPWTGAPEEGFPTKGQVRRIHGELLSPAAEVKVPAGTFDAVHVRLGFRDLHGAPCFQELWFSRGTGLVKHVWGRREKTEGELQLFEADLVPSAHTAEARVRRWLRDNGWDERDADAAEIHWIAPLLYDGRRLGAFVRADDRTAALLMTEERTTTLSLDPTRDWQALREELGAAELHDLAAFVGQFRLLAAGLRSPRILASRGGSDDEGGELDALLYARDAERDARFGTVHVETDGEDRILELTFRPLSREQAEGLFSGTPLPK